MALTSAALKKVRKAKAHHTTTYEESTTMNDTRHDFMNLEASASGGNSS